MIIRLQTATTDDVYLVSDLIRLLVKPDFSMRLDDFDGTTLTFKAGELYSLRVAKSPNLEYDVGCKNGMIFKHINHNPIKGNLVFDFQHCFTESRMATDVVYNGHCVNDVFTIIVRDN